LEGRETAVEPAGRSATAAPPRKPSSLLLLLLLAAAASLALLPLTAAALSATPEMPPLLLLLVMLLLKTAGISCVAAPLDATHLHTQQNRMTYTWHVGNLHVICRM
jgi:hypothetical protein